MMNVWSLSSPYTESWGAYRMVLQPGYLTGAVEKAAYPQAIHKMGVRVTFRQHSTGHGQQNP